MVAAGTRSTRTTLDGVKLFPVTVTTVLPVAAPLEGDSPLNIGPGVVGVGPGVVGVGPAAVGVGPPVVAIGPAVVGALYL